MPIYEYEAAAPGRKCRKCSSVFEVLQRISDLPLTNCPECQKEIRRRISRPRIILPGSARGSDDVEKKVADYERQGMYSHAAELADKESEKPERAPLKERAMEDNKNAGYNFKRERILDQENQKKNFRPFIFLRRNPQCSQR
jgi:putative FmdB family regulatory protein